MTSLAIFTRLWKVDVTAIVVAVVSLVLYVRSRSKGSSSRAPFFALALLFAALATVSPIATLADGYLFSAHMLQHLLLVLVVPPLALLALVEPDAERAAPLTAFALRRPAVMWALGVGAMWLWHEQTLCNAAAQGGLMHALQETSLLAMGGAFWWPVLAPSARARLAPLTTILYLATACIACTLLGVLITFSPVEVCSVFAHPVDHLGVMSVVQNDWGLSAARDQQLGGLLMWVPSCLVYGVGILATVRRLYREDDCGITARGASLHE